MYCKVCNTRFDQGARACPNCGAAPANPGRPEARQPARLPSTSQEIDQGLGEVLEAGVIDARADAGETIADYEPEPQAAPQPAPPSRPRSHHQETQPIVPTSKLDSMGLRKQLADSPETLEPGLKVFTDKQGTPDGVNFTTAVGAIDLLARDRKGNLVVVMVSEPEQGSELVADMLQRLGWVRKHLAKPGEQPRGIVLVEQVPEDLGYAAAAVADTVSFKTWQIAITFADVEF